MRFRLGKVARIQSNIVFIIEEGKNGREYPFTLDKIESYSGERLRELTQFSKKGLQADVLVKFCTDDEGRVTLVRPLVFRE
ncbi:MAG: hypothetical protein HYT93_01995 [Parcubacteria group bacterium]|nr:hypothetical protein [Parcubacteria group bacterium]